MIHGAFLRNAFVFISLYFVPVWITAVWQSIQNFQTSLFCIRFFRDLLSRKSDSRGLKPRGFSAFHVTSPGFVQGGGEHSAVLPLPALPPRAADGRQLKAKSCFFFSVRPRREAWPGPWAVAGRMGHSQEDLCQHWARQKQQLSCPFPHGPNATPSLCVSPDPHQQPAWHLRAPTPAKQTARGGESFLSSLPA